MRVCKKTQICCILFSMGVLMLLVDANAADKFGRKWCQAIISSANDVFPDSNAISSKMVSGNNLLCCETELN
jgi:hypothetical protein